MKTREPWSPFSPGNGGCQASKERPCWPPDLPFSPSPLTWTHGNTSRFSRWKGGLGSRGSDFHKQGRGVPDPLIRPVLLGTPHLASSLCAGRVSLRPWMTHARPTVSRHQHLGSPSGSSEMPSCPLRDVDEGRNGPMRLQGWLWLGSV